ncbi:MAG: hypothetical protein ACJA2S_001572 [Cyclobacteriaceae bacterium]|jgi:hypothetical protein
MKRKEFLKLGMVSGGVFASSPLYSIASFDKTIKSQNQRLIDQEVLTVDMVIAGGGLGGCAAAMAALRNGLTVIITEETDWIGGQLTQQGVPPDEHRWIETHGSTQLYRDLRTAIRAYYKRNYPLTASAQTSEFLNPGNSAVSRIAHEPRVALAVLYEMLLPYISSKKLTILLEHKVVDAEVNGDEVTSLIAIDLNTETKIELKAPYFADATELGDLLPITGTEFVTGTEAKKETRELHAPEKGDPENNQAWTMCFAVDYLPGEDHTIEKPKEYDFWRDFEPEMTPPWSGKILDFSYSFPRTLEPKTLGFDPTGASTQPVLNLWNYRRVINKENFTEGFFNSHVTIINWPQNDYMLGNLIGVSDKEFNEQVERSKQLSLSLLYWLQTEAVRPDGGKGWPGIRLRKDVLGTDDGMAKYPYVRESRRIKAMFTILEEHVGKDNREMVSAKKMGDAPTDFYDSVGVGSYHIDLHPSSKGNNYLDFSSIRFQIPLGALLPKRMKNLLPVNKNIGTTHVTNGCYRLHPIEWAIGESVGSLVAYAMSNKVRPFEVREKPEMLAEFQEFVRSQGIETHWPEA